MSTACGLDACGEQDPANYGDPETEAVVWLDRLAGAEHKRANFQDMAAEGLITFDELRAKLVTLEETRNAARRELAALEGRPDRLRALERDREALLENYADLMPEALEVLSLRNATAFTTC